MEAENKLIAEEQKVLDETIEKMLDVLKAMHVQAEQARKNWKEAKENGNKDEYIKLVSALERMKSAKEEAKKAHKAINGLYDRRLMVKIEDYDGHTEETDIKVGLHNYQHQKQRFITAWFMPVCQHYFTDNADISFDYHDFQNGMPVETKYTLLGKRDITMNFAKVVKVIKKYPLTSEEEQIIFDAFLQNLAERRTSAEFRNIVFSIQKKQAEIVQAPFSKGVVVQGCAGSGKSMIMLHRLPVLLNNGIDNLKTDRLYIVTPSETYIEMVHNLCEELEITDVSMGTIDKYYDRCIQKYKYTGVGYGKISAYAKLTQDSENYIYSKECVSDIRAFIEKQIMSEDINLDKAKSVLLISNKDFQCHTWKDTLNAKILMTQEVINRNSFNINEYYNAMRELFRGLIEFDNLVRNRKASITNAINRKIDGKQKEIEDAKKDLTNLDPEANKKAYGTRKAVITSAEEEISQLRDVLATVSDESEYFVSATAIHNELELSLRQFDLLDEEVYDRTYHEVYDVIGKAGSLIGVYYAIGFRVNQIDDPYLEYASDLNAIYSKIAGSVQNLQNTKLPYLKEDYYTSVVTTNRNLTAKSSTIIDQTYRSVFEMVDYQRKPQGMNTAVSASPYVYLQAIYCYQGPFDGVKDSLVSIDEAQTISEEEIKLIRGVNDNKVVLNLYGDGSQHIEGTKGVDDLSVLAEQTESSYYEMLENYRNACQITNYCNARFHMDMKAINLDGNGVHVSESYEDFCKDFTAVMTKGMKAGISAIIVKDSDEAEYLKKEFAQFSSKFNDITGEQFSLHRNKWNIITIGDAKGLEFETVFAVSGNMSEHEKYIAYTRALDELYVYDGPIEVKREKTQGSIIPDKVEKKTAEIKAADKIPIVTLQEEGSRLKEFFESKGLKVIDNRNRAMKKGHLWVFGEEETVKPLIEEAGRLFGASFMYTSSPESNFKKGWCTRSKK